jgi:glutamyl-tRNA reductase
MEVAPTIATLRKKAEAIRDTELDKTLANLPQLTGKQKKSVELMASAIINKLLHDPILFLKADCPADAKQRRLEMIRGLFGLDQDQAANRETNGWSALNEQKKSTGS